VVVDRKRIYENKMIDSITISKKEKVTDFIQHLFNSGRVPASETYMYMFKSYSKYISKPVDDLT
jgi:hypothetical protein